MADWGIEVEVDEGPDLSSFDISKELREFQQQVIVATPYGKDAKGHHAGTAMEGWDLILDSDGGVLQNLVPYIGVLEEGRHIKSNGVWGGSFQAPNGITGMPTQARPDGLIGPAAWLDARLQQILSGERTVV